MAKKISELTTASTLDGSEVLPIVQDGATKKVTAQDIADLGGGGGAVSSVFGRTGAITAQSGDYTKAQVGLSNVDNTSDANKPVSTAQQTALNAKQATLVSGTNIKTINGTTLLGSGDLTISGGGTIDAVPTDGSSNAVSSNGTFDALTAKQATLVSGTNIKTINGSSILGSGNLSISISGDLPIRDFVNDYGGSGNDIDDNAAAWAAVMADDCRQFKLFVPPGFYKSGSVVNYNPALNVFSTGLNTGVNVPPVTQVYAAVLKTTFAGSYFKTAQDIPTTWFPGKISDIQFEGSNVGLNALDLGRVQAWTVERCGFQNFVGAAVKSYGSLGCDLYGCTFFDNQYDIDMNVQYGMPPNFMNIRNNRFFGAKKYSIRADGGLSMLIVRENNFEGCGTVADSASGLLSINTAYEGVGLIFCDNYIERTQGFASIYIGPASSDVVRYIIENNQANATSGAGPATHDIYVDANGANKQRLSMSNNLFRNGGGLTIDGPNATLYDNLNTFSARNIDPGVKVVRIDDDGVITGTLSGGSTPTDTPFDENILFDGDRITNHTVTGPIAFDPNPAGRVLGGKHKYILIADGTNTPTYHADLIETGVSEPYATTINSVNIITFEWNGSNYTRTNVTAGTVAGGGGGTFPAFFDFEADTTGGTPAGWDVEANMTVTANSYIGGTKELEVVGGNLFNFGIINGATAPLACVEEVDILLHAGHAATEIAGPVQRANSLAGGSVTSFYTAGLRPASQTVELLYFASLGVAPTVIDTVSLSGGGNVLTLTDKYHVYYSIDALHNHIVRVSRSSDGKFLTDVSGVGTWVTGSADLYNVTDTSITAAGGSGIVTVYSSGGPQVYFDNVDVS